jgi:hypothetical protein
MSAFQRFVSVVAVTVLVLLMTPQVVRACDEFCAERADGRASAETGFLWGDGGSRVGLGVGDPAQLFISLDEHLMPVRMADMINGRPLVLVVGSCS